MICQLYVGRLVFIMHEEKVQDVSLAWPFIEGKLSILEIFSFSLRQLKLPQIGE